MNEIGAVVMGNKGFSDGMLFFDHLGQEIELRLEEMQTTSQENSLRFSVVPHRFASDPDRF
jgi:hypothetical protein